VNITVHGHRGANLPIALHAAALDSRFSDVTIHGAIRSWTDVVDEPLSRDQLSNVVPFALELYDLPDLVRAIAPRRVTIEQPVHPTGQPAGSTPPRGE